MERLVPDGSAVNLNKCGGRRSLIHVYSSDPGLLGSNACTSEGCDRGICSVILKVHESIRNSLFIGKRSIGGCSGLELLGVHINPLHRWGSVLFEIGLMTFGVLKHIATIESLGDD